MKASRFMSAMLLTALVCSAAGADDGAINNKSMTKTINLPTFDEILVDETTPVAEHAFTSMMSFYVPARQASGDAPDTTNGDIMSPLGQISGKGVNAGTTAVDIVNGASFQIPLQIRNWKQVIMFSTLWRVVSGGWMTVSPRTQTRSTHFREPIPAVSNVRM